jgi:hypothetical protein
MRKVPMTNIKLAAALVKFFVAVMVMQSQVTLAQEPVAAESIGAIDKLFDQWNAKVPQKKEELFKTLLPFLEQRVKRPITYYEDGEWFEDVVRRIDKEIPATISPKLPIAVNAIGRYKTFFERTRVGLYARRIPPGTAYQDLRPKFYFLMVLAERNALAAKRNAIAFGNIRKALFFWETGLWPLC